MTLWLQEEKNASKDIFRIKKNVASNCNGLIGLQQVNLVALKTGNMIEY